MTDLDPTALDLLRVDEVLWLLVAETGIAIYDFPVDRYFRCSRAPYRVEPVTAVARVGAPGDYDRFYADAAREGVTLIHSPEQHARCSTLSGWYPRIADLTARSAVYEAPPPADAVEREFGWPVFMKGERQTARHRRALSVLRNRAEYEAALAAWSADPILRWQRVAVRELLALRPVPAPVTERIQPAFEFRAFVWRGEVVGFGRYWWEAPEYRCTESERADALRVVRAAARRVNVPFLVVDVAQLLDGRWVVIECNDGQESGYAGVSPIALWQSILEWERAQPR